MTLPSVRYRPHQRDRGERKMGARRREVLATALNRHGVCLGYSSKGGYQRLAWSGRVGSVSPRRAAPVLRTRCRSADMRFLFEDCVLDPDRRELARGSQAIAVGPQVFDLLVYLVRNRDRVVGKDDLLDAVWGGRIVSESTMTSH